MLEIFQGIKEERELPRPSLPQKRERPLGSGDLSYATNY